MDTAMAVQQLDPQRWVRQSYSQEGEDLVLLEILGDQREGFFVDAGAFHPFRFSNTFLLYQRGWRGLNVDATPGSMDLFDQARPRDINREYALSDSDEMRMLYLFDEPALNTLCQERAHEIDRNTPFRLVGTAPVEAIRLDTLLAREMPEGQAIDVMNVDLEGWDPMVLESNDWIRFRPRLVLVEERLDDLRDLSRSRCIEMLGKVGYRPVCKTVRTLFFIREEPALQEEGRSS